jgi:AcrR family transcriptional regulator
MTRAAQAERTRGAILATARKLFATHGYDATSLQMIADAMDVTKANVYYYFRTKSDILEALLDASIAAFDAMLAEVARIRGRRARAEVLVAGFAEQVVANRALSPLGQTDPGMRRNVRINAELDRQAAEAMRLLYGDEPTDELRGLLVRLCLRVLRA